MITKRTCNTPYYLYGKGTFSRYEPLPPNPYLIVFLPELRCSRLKFSHNLTVYLQKVNFNITVLFYEGLMSKVTNQRNIKETGPLLIPVDW